MLHLFEPQEARKVAKIAFHAFAPSCKPGRTGSRHAARQSDLPVTLPGMLRGFHKPPAAHQPFCAFCDMPVFCVFSPFPALSAMGWILYHLFCFLRSEAAERAQNEVLQSCLSHQQSIASPAGPDSCRRRHPAQPEPYA